MPLVLVVDDAQMVRDQVALLLGPAGFDVIEAADGVEALTKLQTPGLALIVLDVNMPRMNGLEFLRILRAQAAYANLPVIMLTTEGEPQMIEKAKSLGAKGWVVKPFRPELLLGAAQKLTRV